MWSELMRTGFAQSQTFQAAFYSKIPGYFTNAPYFSSIKRSSSSAPSVRHYFPVLTHERPVNISSAQMLRCDSSLVRSPPPSP